MNTDRLPSIPAEEYHTASRSGRTCRADCWPTAGTSTVALAKADANPTDLCRRKTCGEIAEGKSPALALGRQLGRAGSQEPGDVARLRSVGCRAGAARNYAVADLTEKAKRGCVSPDSTDEENRGLLPGFVLSDAAQARHRNYAEADLTEKAKRIRVSPFLLNLVEHIGVEPMTSCMPCRRSSQLS